MGNIHTGEKPSGLCAAIPFEPGSVPCEYLYQEQNQDLEFTVYSWHDVLTVNEVFFREDYYIPEDSKVCVDFGGNIGITTGYFLNHADCVVYTYEPSPYSIDKLRMHTEKYADRCFINPVAVSDVEGSATFGVEQTGRYGGIGVATGQEITVRTVSASKELAGIIAKFGKIDVLKIDIENMELEILNSLGDDILQKIRYIHVEYLGELPFRKEYFSRTKRGTIFTYRNTSL